ncbi:MAG: methyltransferase domain-containing protein [Chitinispirillaceae bacterium]|nr:methyltransferase domain-containing protein [Chitinispirillaceae bacterium]
MTVQSELCRLLAAKLAASGLSTGTWADLGCGTGTFAGECEKKGFRGRIVCVDISFEPLLACRKRCATVRPLNVQADIEYLPFRTASFDVAVTASTLQWLDDPPAALKDISAVLKNGGLLAFSVFVEGSFRELFSIQKRFGIPAPVRCLEASGFTGALADAGFDAVKYETVERTVHEATAAAVLKSVSTAGSSATAAERLLNRKELAEFCGAYETAFRSDGAVHLTYRAMAGVCRKGRPS